MTHAGFHFPCASINNFPCTPYLNICIYVRRVHHIRIQKTVEKQVRCLVNNYFEQNTNTYISGFPLRFQREPIIILIKRL